MTDLYSEWRDFYAEKVLSWMSLEELRAECGKLQTVDSRNPEVLLVHAMHALEELQAEVERLRDDGASAVRWAPGSAYWSEVLVELFGPDARKGIDVLEARWRKELERADTAVALLRQTTRSAVTFCDNCGCNWLDDGLNPIGCPYCKQSAAVAAIQFALNDPEGMTFLRLWNEGEFDTLRREWPDAPSVVYVGADPLATKHQEPPLAHCPSIGQT